MHELSIATRLVELATEAVRSAGEPRAIEAVHIRVGALSGVVTEALEFCWEVAAEGTACAGSRLEVEAVPARVHCPSCGADSTLESPHRFRCGRCGELTADVVAGRELDLVSLELSDDPPPSPLTAVEASHSTAHP
jgi:hydrogenase nickel incorporation protein HypA/HybF